LGDEREVALDVGREDDIRRVLDEEPVALLALAQLPLEALPLGDVAGGALDPGEHAVAPDAYRADLERADAAVALLEVHPRRQLELRVGGQQRELGTRDLVGTVPDEVAELRPD